MARSQHRRMRFTRFGSFYIFFSLAVGAAAVNSGNNLLYIILGLSLGLIVLSGIFSDSCIWGLDFEWLPVPGDWYAGQTRDIPLRLSKRFFPAVQVIFQAKVQGQDAVLEKRLDYLSPGTHRIVSFPFLPTQRGYLRIEGRSLRSGFPFGLFEKSRRLTGGASVIVYPALIPISSKRLFVGNSELAPRGRTQKGRGDTPHDLRDFRQGDPKGWIHWKASAKRSRLLVKEMEEERQESRGWVIASWPSSASAQEAFISFVASLAVWTYRQGKPFSLRSADFSFAMDLSGHHLRQVLTALALAKPNPGASCEVRTDEVDLRKWWEFYETHAA